MIQRLQTVFLAIAAILMSLLFSRPMSFATTDLVLPAGNVQSMLADGVYNTQDHILLLMLAILGILVPLITIFLYRNRPLQMKLSRLSIALAGLFIVLIIVLLQQNNQELAFESDIPIEYGYGYIIPVLAILFLALALRYIRKDEKLVRSADRLR
jgi:peptidoglycan/LPS O-acetylase OafA/YrhL